MCLRLTRCLQFYPSTLSVQILVFGRVLLGSRGLVWRVPKVPTVVDSAKGPKAIDAPPGLIRWNGGEGIEGGPTHCAQTMPAG